MTADTKTARSLACLEVWGGNCAVQEGLELPGLSAWVYSRPLHDAERGEMFTTSRPALTA